MKRRFGRFVAPIAIVNLKLYTFLTGRPRARVLVVNEFDEVLLIQALFSDGRWSLPGGGLKRTESAVAAARRELQEETGIDADETDFMYMTTLSKPEYRVPFTAPLYYLRVTRSSLPDQMVNTWEISSIAWFQRDKLPEPLSVITKAALELETTI